MTYILKEVNVDDIRFKIYVNPDGAQLCQKSINRKGKWESWVTQWLLDHLKEDTVFVDAGASVGWFALIVAASSQQTRVVAYEPDAERCLALRDSKTVNGFDNLTVFSQALMDEPCNVNLGGRAHARVQLGCGEIVAVSLDDSLESINQCKVDLVKIDVEGAELRVLKGMVDTINANPHIQIIVEIHPRLMKALFRDTMESLFSFMDDLGFKKTNLTGRYWVFSK